MKIFPTVLNILRHNIYIKKISSSSGFIVICPLKSVNHYTGSAVKYCRAAIRHQPYINSRYIYDSIALKALAWQSLRAIAIEWQIGQFSGVYAAATIIIRMNPFFLDISAYKLSDYDDDGNAGADFGVNIDLNLVFNVC